MKLKIERPHYVNGKHIGKEYIAVRDINRWFDEQVEPINKLLADGVEVSCRQSVMERGKFKLWEGQEWKYESMDTHRALLINIQPIKQETAEDVLRDYMKLSEKFPQKDWEQLESRAKKVLNKE